MTLNTDLFQNQFEQDPKQFGQAVRVSNSGAGEVSTRMVLNEDAFVSMLYLERRRAERAQKRYVLILMDVKGIISGKEKKNSSKKIAEAVSRVTRETDIIGWYLKDELLGVIGTELGQATSHMVRKTISEKLRQSLSEFLGPHTSSSVPVSFHFFPEDGENGDSGNSPYKVLYPDLRRKAIPRRLALGLKRIMDIIGSACALALLSPLFLLIALAIKFTSKGPVLFRQRRLGQFGKEFVLLKFRSMSTECDSRIHREYVSRFISGQVSSNAGDPSKPVFKLRADPRVTPVGSMLRKTSIDELPQFWNVLKGEMSLVGPRPPVEYEFKAYQVWHRRRVLEVKPGITGLWQVKGRSKTTFDDMVRLDLLYSKDWSLLLDLKLLLLTPWAVLSGDGAH